LSSRLFRSDACYSALRKIERQAHVVEVAAKAAADSAKAALLLAQAQERAERPWIMVTAEPDPGIRDCFSVMATNRGHSPTKIVTLVDSIATANDESQLPAEPVFHAEPRAPRDPIFLLPVNRARSSRSAATTCRRSAITLKTCDAWKIGK